MHKHEDGMMWFIATMLMNGPQTRDQIIRQMRGVHRRFGFFTDVHEVQENHFELQLQQKLRHMLEQQWVFFEDGCYRLTELGQTQAKKAQTEGTQAINRLKTLFLGPQAAARVTLVVHLLLAAIKLPAGLISGSVGLINDALDTLLDGISSLFVLWGLKYQKEMISNVLLVLCMIGTGGMALFQAIEKMMVPYQPQMDIFPFVATILSGIVAYGLMLYQKYIGSKYRSLSLITQSLDSRNHAWVALGVLAGLISAWLHFVWLDVSVGLLVAFLILKGAVETIIDLWRISGGEEIDFARHQVRFQFHEKFEQKQMTMWMLQLINNQDVQNQAELMAFLRQSLDFSDNVPLQTYGLHHKPNTNQLIQQSWDTLCNSGWIQEESFSVTIAGQKQLKDQKQNWHGKKNPLLLTAHLLFVALIYGILWQAANWLQTFLPSFPGFDFWALSTFWELCSRYIWIGVGLLLFAHGFFKVMQASRFLRSVMDKRERKPLKLLVDEPFARVRHPMYGGFVFLHAGLWCATGNGWFILVAWAVFFGQYANACWEEKRVLIPLFEQEYIQYKQQVSWRLLSFRETLVLLLCLVAATVGAIG